MLPLIVLIAHCFLVLGDWACLLGLSLFGFKLLVFQLNAVRPHADPLFNLKGLGVSRVPSSIMHKSCSPTC